MVSGANRTLFAQAPDKPDSPEARQLLEAAKKNAGTEWAEAFDFICALNAGRANSPTDPVIEPTKVFDNLYVIGRTSTVVWAVTTSAGIVRSTPGTGDQLESVLLPGMKTLGLDPAQVKYVIVGHGHGDHFGGTATSSSAAPASSWQDPIGISSRRPRPPGVVRRSCNHQSATSSPSKARRSWLAMSRSRR